ncbi:MAG: FeoA family protein [Bacillota bacterium]|jgi:ferrous iron transport protein A
MTPLSEVAPGLEATLLSHETGTLLAKRLLDLGFTPGTRMKVVRRGPRDNLIAVNIRNTMIALRRLEASKILVDPLPLETGTG